MIIKVNVIFPPLLSGEEKVIYMLVDILQLYLKIWFHADIFDLP